MAEYKDPPWVSARRSGKPLVQMLLDGEIDAAIVGENPGAAAQAADPGCRGGAPRGPQDMAACRSTT